MKNAFKRNSLRLMLITLVAICTACGGNSENKKKMADESGQKMEAQSDTTSAPGPKLNLNTASGNQFHQIPNVGDRMVHEFEEYRPYVSIKQFRKEIGKYVDENQVAAYEDYVYVPIDANESDMETLMQIPGLDKDEAQKLIDNRPYDTNQAFFDAIASYINEQQMVVAKRYMKSN